MNKNAKIFVTGHNGMVGSAIVRELRLKGYNNLLLISSSELDLRKQGDVFAFLQNERPNYIFMAAAHVGGIQANEKYPVDFLMDNLEIQNSIFRAAHASSINRLLFLGSACMFPKVSVQPIDETAILKGPLEPTNEAYAIAKITGLRACEYYNRQYQTQYIGVIPANCYGINDCFDIDNAHVIPSLLRKYHYAKLNNEKSVTIWGTGVPQREFLFVDDLAAACVFLMEKNPPLNIINIGSGHEISILELSKLIKEVIGYRGDIICNIEKPDGMMRRIVDCTKMRELGWGAETSLKEGLTQTYQWFLEHILPIEN